MYVGARSPEALVLTVVDASFDFTTVVSADLEVRRPDRESVVWSWALDATTPGRLRLTHEFAADGSDVPLAGGYTISGDLLTASSRRRIVPATRTAQQYP